MSDDEKLNFIMQELNKFPELRNQQIEFNKKYFIPLWDKDSWIEYKIKGEEGELVDWGKPLPEKTKFSVHIFTEDNKEPYRIENHAEPRLGGDYVLHRNIDNNGEENWIKHKEYSYSPFYSTVSSFLGGFPEERDTIRNDLKKHFNW